jgi:hypothetical protein
MVGRYALPHPLAVVFGYTPYPPQVEQLAVSAPERLVGVLPKRIGRRMANGLPLHP